MEKKLEPGPHLTSPMLSPASPAKFLSSLGLTPLCQKKAKLTGLLRAWNPGSLPVLAKPWGKACFRYGASRNMGLLLCPALRWAWLTLGGQEPQTH